MNADTPFTAVSEPGSLKGFDEMRSCKQSLPKSTGHAFKQLRQNCQEDSAPASLQGWQELQYDLDQP